MMKPRSQSDGGRGSGGIDNDQQDVLAKHLNRYATVAASAADAEGGGGFEDAMMAAAGGDEAMAMFADFGFTPARD